MIVRLYDAKRIVGSTGLAFNVEGHIDIVTDEQYTESVIISQENHRLDVEWTNRADDHDKDKVLSFLKALKESDFFIEYIYTRGGCYQLYKVLKSLWTSAQPYLGVHMAHVITRIGDRYFDINGEVKIDGDFLPMTAEEEQEVATWSFAGNNELYLGHCPVCDEPITIDRNKLIKPKNWRMEMLKLELKEFERKICEAVRKAERLPENYRLYVQKIGYTITKDETPNEVQAEVAVTEGKIERVKYLLAWDGEKNEFCRPQMIWRKYAHYRLMADFGMFNPLTRAVAGGYQEYAIAHLLRELGFRKESAYYIVKAKGMKPVKFKLNRNNFWHIEHHDFNGDSKFYPSMAQQWELPWGDMGTPYYQPFDHEGNIYTVPSLDQIHEFCCRRGFACYGIHEPQEIIRHLVFMYRKLNNDQTAFRKYVERK